LRFVHQDSLSSTSLTTSSNGDVVASVKYFPFGGTRSQSGTLDTDKLFTGQRLDDTGLYYYNARYYDATIGRFIRADTIVQNYMNPQTLNRYSYCLNNPLKYVDPSGHEADGDYNGDGKVNVLDLTVAKNTGQSQGSVIQGIFHGSAGVGNTNPAIENTLDVAGTIIVETLENIPEGSYAEDLRRVGPLLDFLLSANKIVADMEVDQANGIVDHSEALETTGGCVTSYGAASGATWLIKRLFTSNPYLLIAYGTASAVLGEDVGETVTNYVYDQTMEMPLAQYYQYVSDFKGYCFGVIESQQ
jgi:RHS repeat-associated protein